MPGPAGPTAPLATGGGTAALSDDSLARRVRRLALLVSAVAGLLTFAIVFGVGRAALIDERDAALQEDWVALASQASAVQARTGPMLQPSMWFDTTSFRPAYQPDGDRFFIVLDPQDGHALSASPSVRGRGLMLDTPALAGDVARRVDALLPDGVAVSLLARRLPVVGVQAAPPAGEGARPAVPSLRQIDPVLLVGRSDEAFMARVHQLAFVCAAGALLVGLLSGALLGWAAPRALAPVRALADAANRHDPDAGRPLPRSAQRELAPIVERFNLLVARHDNLRRSERRLFDDMAQELRVPLAELQALSDVALLRSADPRLQAEAMGQVRRLARGMNAQVDLLFLLARHAGGTPLNVQPLALAELVGAALADARPAAEGRSLSWHCEGASDLRLRTDHDLAHALVDALMSHVLAHARTGGELRVRWGEECKGAGPWLEIGCDDCTAEVPVDSTSGLETARRAAAALGAELLQCRASEGVGLRLAFTAASRERTPAAERRAEGVDRPTAAA